MMHAFLWNAAIKLKSKNMLIINWINFQAEARKIRQLMVKLQRVFHHKAILRWDTDVNTWNNRDVKIWWQNTVSQSVILLHLPPSNTSISASSRMSTIFKANSTWSLADWWPHVLLKTKMIFWGEDLFDLDAQMLKELQIPDSHVVIILQ